MQKVPLPISKIDRKENDKGQGINKLKFKNDIIEIKEAVGDVNSNDFESDKDEIKACTKMCINIIEK